MANSQIVVERNYREKDDKGYPLQGGARGALVGSIMGDVLPWRRRRDDEFEALWDEFYAKWRGFWMPEHKSYKSERSRIISPLTSMSVDLTSAEIIEAVLGREYFIDLPDDIDDNEVEDVQKARLELIQDLRNDGFPHQFANAVTNGCLYGNGIFKIQIGVKEEWRQLRSQDGRSTWQKREVPLVRPVAIDPGQFVYDPTVADIDDMKGCAHEFPLGLHIIKERQDSGVYYQCKVASWNKLAAPQNRGDTEAGNSRVSDSKVAFVTEYYGRVSYREFLAAQAEGKGNPLPDEMLQAIPDDEMIEVIATIANESQLLRVMENPLETGERLVVAYQHETVPNRFVGRGVAEKGANVQRAMDAEMRGRIDALAWANVPMFAGDMTRLPPGQTLSAWPGKFWGTRGNPNEVLREMKVSGPDANSYQHVADLERMGQQATGALDSPQLRAGMRDETATGSALAASSFIKRSKRTMYNIEDFLNRMVTRTLRLKMQFEPERYPKDYTFQVRGTIGMMAREVEQQSLVNLAQVLGGDHPATMPIIKAIFENASTPAKLGVLKAIQAMEEQNKPTPQMQQLQEQAKMAQLMAPIRTVQKLEAEIANLQAQADLRTEQADKTAAETDSEVATTGIEKLRILNDLEETKNQARQLDILEDRVDIERQRVATQARQSK